MLLSRRVWRPKRGSTTWCGLEISTFVLLPTASMCADGPRYERRTNNKTKVKQQIRSAMWSCCCSLISWFRLVEKARRSFNGRNRRYISVLLIGSTEAAWSSARKRCERHRTATAYCTKASQDSLSLSTRKIHVPKKKDVCFTFV
jgi:hypothetical protein